MHSQEGKRVAQLADEVKQRGVGRVRKVCCEVGKLGVGGLLEEHSDVMQLLGAQ